METSSTFGSMSDHNNLSFKQGHPANDIRTRGSKKHPFIAVLILIASWCVLAWVFVSSLPDVRPLKSPRYNMTIMVRDLKGRKVPFIVGPRNPYWTPLSHIPPALQWGVIVAEDDTFYEHKGFNFAAMRDAMWEDIKRRKFARGGSTITQQLAKNLYLSREKSLARKFKEAIIAGKLERHLRKKKDPRIIPQCY